MSEDVISEDHMSPSDLEARIEAIEKRLNRLEKGQVMARHEEHEEVKHVKHEPAKPHEPNAFIEWLKRDTLMKVGAFLLLLATGWFVSYAFANNWIGPVGRIALGIVVGALVLVFGHLQIPKRSEVGQVLVTTGGTMMLLTLYGARVVYDFFTPGSALAMMALIVVAMAVIAIVNRKPAVAYMALLGGAVAPLLTHSPSPDYIALMSYIFLLNIGVLITVALRGWRGLITLAIIITGIFSLPSFDGMEDKVIWLFMGLFFVQFFASITAAILHSKKAFTSDVISTGLNGLIFLGWVVAFVPDEWSSLILSAIVLVMLAVSYVFLRMGQLEAPLYINAGLAVLFLGIATAIELDGSALVTAYGIEALVLVLVTQYLTRQADNTQAVSLLQAVPFLFAFDSMRRLQSSDTVFNEHFFALLVVFLSIAVTAGFLYKLKEQSSVIKIVPLHVILATIVGGSLIWLTAHNALDSVNVARGVSLVVYTVLGVASLFRGTQLDNKAMRIYGGSLLGLVIIRLLFVEVWNMTLVSRIVTFAAIAVLLIATAFFQKKHSS